MSLRLSFYLFILASYSLMANELKLDSFNSIKISGPVNVSLVKSDEYKADFSMAKGRKQDLVIEVINSVLTVRIKAPENSKWNRPISGANITIYFIDLNSIICSSGSKITANDTLVANHFTINCSKNSICRVNLKSKHLDVSAHTGSTIYLNGDTDELSISISSNATFSSPLFTANNANIDASSNASVSIIVIKKLVANASANAIIKYTGSPEDKVSNAHSGGKIISG